MAERKIVKDTLTSVFIEPIMSQYNCSQDVIFPSVEVIKDSGQFIITENPSFKESDMSMSTYFDADSVSLYDDQVNSLPHDMVLSFFKSDIMEPDVSFSSYFGVSGEAHLDRPSPDLLMTISDRVYCFEVGTSRNPQAGKRVYCDKYFKYDEVLRERAQNSFLLIVSVTPSTVCTNYPMKEETAQILIARYRYGCMLQSKCKELGWKGVQDDWISQQEWLVRNQIQDFKWLNINDELTVNEDLIKKWDNTEDVDYITNWRKKMIENLTNSLEFDKNDYKKTIDNYRNSLVGNKDNMKKIGFLPMFVAQEAERIPFVPMSNGNQIQNAMIELWQESIDNKPPEAREMSLSDLEDNMIEVVDENLIRKEEEHIKKLRKQNRTVLNLQKETQEVLSRRGYLGKRFKNHASVKGDRIQSKEGFSWNADTSDIEEFLRSWPELMTHHNNPMEERYCDLLDYSQEMNHQTAEFIGDFMNTKLFTAIHVIEVIISEMNLNIRRPCKSDEWVFCSCKPLPIDILLHTTGSGKHIFYSILCPKESVVEQINGPFPPLIDIGSHYTTELRSLDVHDVSHMLGLTSKFMSMSAVFYDIWDEEHEYFKSTQCSEEILFSLLVLLENKEHTSSPLQNIRYMYMEMVRPNIVKCDPFKIFSKMPKIVRSRLLLLAIRRLVKSFSYMLDNRKEVRLLGSGMTEEEEIAERDNDTSEDYVEVAKDKIPGLISFISMRELPSFECALNLSYLGVFHNADKGEEIHGFLKIFSKVILEEKKMREGEFRPEFGAVKDPENVDWSIGPDELRSHEFNLVHCKRIGRKLSDHFSKKGLSFQDVNDRIISKLSEISFSDLATFKASAVEIDRDTKYGNFDPKPRNKAIEEVLRIMEEFSVQTCRPFTQLEKVFELVTKMGGLISNLFKKNQLTGVREIFVLVMASRMLVRILESISRTLCELCDNEYLTKGVEKTGSTAAHYRKVNQMRQTDEKTMTVCDSNDATTWCQRFIMPTFSSMFHEIFVGNPIEKIIHSILNLVTDKRLELPKKLLDIFYRNTTVETFDPAMEELKNQFLGLSDKNDIIDIQGIFLKNRSNFMQGILHYTSSLLHAGHNLILQEEISDMYKTVFGNQGRIVTTTKVSSDDSSRISSIIFNPKRLSARQIGELRIFLLATSSLVEASYPLFGAKMSPKSTNMVLCGIEEFNSTWTISNTVMTPKIKWAYSSQIYKVSSSVSERQNMDHNLLNDLITNGCRRTTVQVAEFGCMLNHYSCTGMYTTSSDLWNDLIEKIFEQRTNMSWFYFLSHNVIGTSLGMRFTKWLNLHLSEDARRSDWLSRRIGFGEVGENGEFNLHASLPIGFGENYKRFLIKNQIPTDDEMIDMLEGKEDLLFREGRNREEEQLKIFMKCKSVGVSKAFSFSSASKQHSMAAYINSRPCITIRTTEGKMKCCLPSLIKRISDLTTDKETEMTVENFPQIEMYERLYYQLEKDLLVSSKLRKRRRKFLLKIFVPKMADIAQVTLEKVVKNKWFAIDVMKPKFLIDLSFSKYQKLLPWLKLDFKQSFDSFNEMMGVSDVISFSEYIRNFNEKNSTVMFLHSGRIQPGVEKSLLSCFRFNFHINHQLREVKKTNRYWLTKELSSKLSDLASDLYKAKTFYDCTDRSNFLMDRLFREEASINANIGQEEISSVPERSLPLLMILSASKNFCKDDLSSDERYQFLDLMEKTNNGMLMTYLQKQDKREDGTWTGYGIIGVKIGKILARIHIKEHVIKKIETNSVARLITRTSEMKEILDSQNLISDTSERKWSAALTYRQNMRLNMSRDSFGTPILEDKSMDFNIMSQPLSFRIGVNKAGNLSLKFNLGGTTGETISFRPRMTTSGTSQIDGDSLVDKWTRGEKTGIHGLQDVYHLIEEDGDFEEWCVMTLKTRLSFLGKLPEYLPIGNFTEDVLSVEEETPKRYIDVSNIDIKSIISKVFETTELSEGIDENDNKIASLYDDSEDKIPTLWGDREEYYDRKEEEKKIIEKDWMDANIPELLDNMSLFEPTMTMEHKVHPFYSTNEFWDTFISIVENKIGTLSVRRMSINMSYLSGTTVTLLRKLGYKSTSEDDSVDFV